MGPWKPTSRRNPRRRFHDFQNLPPPPRNRTVDLVKSSAIFGVLLIHASAGCLSGPVSAPWLSGLFWNALARPAVPLFLMASGALLLPPER